MKITVSREHIESGKCNVAQRCAIAAAIKDVYRDVSYVSVRTNGITITERRKDGGSVRKHLAVPLKAARAIIRFDAGEDVRPFSFESKLIDQKVIQPVDRATHKKNATNTRKRRVALAAQGKSEPKYGKTNRISGV
jgi:hypothetical protein